MLHTTYHVAFRLFRFVLIYALKEIDFIPHFHRATYTNKSIRSQYCQPCLSEPSALKRLLDKILTRYPNAVIFIILCFTNTLLQIFSQKCI